MGVMDILQGAGGGAATGGAIGGPWGAGIGALGGGLLAGFSSNSQDNQNSALEKYRQQILARGFPQIAAPQMAGNSEGYRADQQALISRLGALSRGEGPSAALQAMTQATDRNMAQQQSIAQSGRGNAALANIVAANNTNNFGQQAAQQGEIARIQEQNQANQLLGQNLGAARAADEQTAQFNAQQNNYASKDNLDAKLRLLGLNDSAIASVMNQQAAAAQRPTLGEQLLAGGVGALGMYAANQRGGGGGGGNNFSNALRTDGLVRPY